MIQEGQECVRKSRHAASSPEFLTERELCSLLRVTRPTILKWRNEAGLPFLRQCRLIRYPRVEVLEWIRALMVVNGARPRKAARSGRAHRRSAS